MTFKLSIPTVDDFYANLIAHPKVHFDRGIEDRLWGPVQFSIATTTPMTPLRTHVETVRRSRRTVKGFCMIR